MSSIWVFKALRAAGYNGWVSGEFLPKPTAETAARKGLEALQQAMEGKRGEIKKTSPALHE